MRKHRAGFQPNLLEISKLRRKMSRLNLCPPRKKKTRKMNLPSWRQMRKLTSQATSLVISSGKQLTPLTHFLACLSLLIIPPPAEGKLFWAYLSSPPVAQPVTWEDPTPKIHINFSILGNGVPSFFPSVQSPINYSGLAFHPPICFQKETHPKRLTLSCLGSVPVGRVLNYSTWSLFHVKGKMQWAQKYIQAYWQKLEIIGDGVHDSKSAPIVMNQCPYKGNALEGTYAFDDCQMYSPKTFSPHEVDFPIFDLSRSARHTSTSTLGPILKPLRLIPSYMRIPNAELQEHTRAIPRSILLTSTGKVHRDLWKLYAAFDQIYTNDSIGFPEAILNPTFCVRTCVPPPFFLVIGNGQVTVEKTKTSTFYRLHCPSCILTNYIPIDKKIDFNTKLFLVQQPPYWMIPVDVRGPWYANFGMQLAQELVKKLRRTPRFLGLLIAGIVATIALIASATVSVVSLHENAQTAEHVNEFARNVTVALDAQKRIDEKIEAQIEALKEAILYLGDQFVVLKTITQLTCHDAYKHICVTPLPFNGSWENVRMHLQGFGIMLILVWIS
ncbi:unnamed protein product [Nyctereutes procyonoides]|uniref:(raccoon dog) hypothetical protein n=1 Tax=Nyctereutes procyonoides TaxID=34880 RepID=A0A811XZN7_NYCPR|nr:unnamed protein product [Nyctereutes procyonoides]